MRLNISKKAALSLAFVSAVLVGGAGTAVVSAAIPSSSDHKVHACYRNNASLTDAKGSLRVIDSDAGTNCTTQETALNWDQVSAPAAAPVAYAHFTSHFDNEIHQTVIDFDSSRSSNISLAQMIVTENGDTYACLSVGFTPKNIQVTGGAGFPEKTGLKIAGTDVARNNWSSDMGNQTCQSVTGANVFMEPGQDTWVAVAGS